VIGELGLHGLEQIAHLIAYLVDLLKLGDVCLTAFKKLVVSVEEGGDITLEVFDFEICWYALRLQRIVALAWLFLVDEGYTAWPALMNIAGQTFGRDSSKWLRRIG
jgi:hypothetical protein